MIEMRVILTGMQFLSKISTLKLCRCQIINNKRFITTFLLPNKDYKHVRKIDYFITKRFCSEKKNTLFETEKNVQQKLEHVIAQNKVIFRETEQKIRKTGSDIIKDIKTTKDKVKIRMEEVIERENIYTIPNLLCVGRMVISPYLGILIVQSNFNMALAVLGFAAVTDLVKVKFL